MHEKKSAAVELFVGAGGITEAIKKHFDIKCSIEYDPIIAKTYELNHGKDHLLIEDINNLNPNEILSFTGLTPSELDLLVVSPPCQGFSRHSRKRATEVTDKRNKLIMQTIRYSNTFNPKYIFFENVASITKFPQFHRFVRILANIKSDGNKRINKWPSYHIRFERVNASDYNVPQNRKRLILIAKRIDTFPNTDAIVNYTRGQVPTINLPHNIWPDKKKAPSLGVYLSKYNLQKLNSGETCKIDPLHRARRLSDTNIKRIKATPRNGGSRNSWPLDLQLACHKKAGVSFSDVYGRMSYDDYSPTITTGCTSYSKGRFGHPVENRAITLKEAALIQTFPETYKFTGTIDGSVNTGSMDKIATQIGNAVPVNMAIEFINAIKKDLLTVKELTLV